MKDLNCLIHPITEPVYGLLEDPERIWINIDNEIGFIPKNQTDTIISRPFKGIDMGKINYLYPDADRVCWFACDDGLVRFELDYEKDFNQDFNVFVRSIILSNDSVIFNGNYYSTGT